MKIKPLAEKALQLVNAVIQLTATVIALLASICVIVNLIDISLAIVEGSKSSHSMISKFIVVAQWYAVALIAKAVKNQPHPSQTLK